MMFLNIITSFWMSWRHFQPAIGSRTQRHFFYFLLLRQKEIGERPDPQCDFCVIRVSQRDLSQKLFIFPASSQTPPSQRSGHCVAGVRTLGAELWRWRSQRWEEQLPGESAGEPPDSVRAQRLRRIPTEVTWIAATSAHPGDGLTHAPGFLRQCANSDFI